MARGHYGVALRQIHTLFNVGTFAGLTDGQLLERFLTQRDETAELAFAVLVERHGPMVLRVCRRVLTRPHDVEDAFQAAFLVLVRRASLIRKHESVGSWLHGVAYRVATCARAASVRRRLHEQRRAEMAALDVGMPEEPDVGPALHEEVGRLPERFRAPVVLCDLEGLTYEEAARQLGWPLGTIKSRLARGRQRLRERLVRRGLAPSAGVLSASLAAECASAAVPRNLLDATVRAAMRYAAGKAATAGTVSASVASLTEGVLKTMFLTKLKTAVLVVGVVATGAGVWAKTDGNEDPDAKQAPAAAAARSDTDRLTDLDAKLDVLLKTLGEYDPRRPHIVQDGASHHSGPSTNPAEKNVKAPPPAGQPVTPSLSWRFGQPTTADPFQSSPSHAFAQTQGWGNLNPKELPQGFPPQGWTFDPRNNIPFQTQPNGQLPFAVQFQPNAQEPFAFFNPDAREAGQGEDPKDGRPLAKPLSDEQRNERFHKILEQWLRMGPVRLTCSGDLEVSMRIKDAKKLEQAKPILDQMLKQGVVNLTLDSQSLTPNLPPSLNWNAYPGWQSHEPPAQSQSRTPWDSWSQQFRNPHSSPGEKPQSAAAPSSPDKALADRLTNVEQKLDQILKALGDRQSDSRPGAKP
ncbi:MAG TPA: RNA polymerase sigma factor [Isosphaeraceae bacterium]|nr:RNA polymerase sigma factor [Isosphaeraceae bacterium]